MALVAACGTTDISGDAASPDLDAHDLVEVLPDALPDAEPDIPLPECGNGILEEDEQCDDGNDVAWDGCHACAISEFLVNTRTAGVQRMPGVGMAPDGRFVIAWCSWDGPSYPVGVVGQRYDVEGAPVGSEFLVSRDVTWLCMRIGVAVAESGSFIIVWEAEGETGFDIRARRYGADGEPLGSDFLVNTNTDDYQRFPSVSTASDGRFVVVWGSDNPWLGVNARLFDEAGNPRGPEFRINPDSEDPGTSRPAVSMNDSGEFVIVWDDNEPVRSWLAQYFDASGEAAGDLIEISRDSGHEADVAMDRHGGFIVVHEGDETDTDGGIYVKAFDASGVMACDGGLLNDFTLNEQARPAVSFSGGESVVAAWDSRDQDGDDMGIFARLLSFDCALGSTEFMVNTYTSGNQTTPAVDMAPDGRFVVVWTSHNQEFVPRPDGLESEDDVFAQRFDTSGNPLGTMPW